MRDAFADEPAPLPLRLFADFCGLCKQSIISVDDLCEVKRISVVPVQTTHSRWEQAKGSLLASLSQYWKQVLETEGSEVALALE